MSRRNVARLVPVSDVNKHLVFVYGTLRRGNGLHGILVEGGAGFVGDGLTVNKYHMTASGCPFVHPEVPTSRIVGEVYKVNDALLARLDQVEGFRGQKDNSNYYREAIEVELSNGETVLAGIYFNVHALSALAIPSGDYKDKDKCEAEAEALYTESLFLKGIQTAPTGKRTFYARNDVLKILGDAARVVSVSGIATSVFVYDGYLYNKNGGEVTCVKRAPKRLRIKLA